MSRPTIALVGGALLTLGASLPALAQSHAAHDAAPQAARSATPPSTRQTPVRAASAFRAPAGANVITIVARDYAFESPASVPAGLTTIRLRNEGPELHHVYLMKLAPGKSLGDLLAAMKTPGPFPAWATPMGGPNSPRPGGESYGTLDLPAGDYALLCVIPSPDGTPHVMKGMSKALKVTAPAGRAASPGAVPSADVTMRLDSYTFTLDRPIRAGARSILVRNQGEQPHEVFVARLAPGKTVGDLLAWVEKPNGPPPGEPVGGTSDIRVGGWNLIQADFAPGDYALICFTADAKDGKPHFMHGMTRQITVR